MLCILYVVLAMMIKIEGTSIYVIVVNSTLVFLFLSFTIPLVAAMLITMGWAVGPNPRPAGDVGGPYKLVTVLSVVGMAIILFIAVAPPNERVLYVVEGFIARAPCSSGSRWETASIGPADRRRRSRARKSRDCCCRSSGRRKGLRPRSS